MKPDALWIVVSKELLDALRDRRSIVAGLLFAVLGPLALLAALKAMIASEQEAGGQALHLVGAARAPGLANHLRSAGVGLLASEESPERLLARMPGAVVLAVPPGAPVELAGGRAAWIELWADMSDAGAGRQARRIQGLVAAYGAQLSEQRLLGAGVAPAAATALALELRDMGNAGGKAALVLGALPVFWLLAMFIGGSHVAQDATAGERERRSLESLLAQPLSTGALFVGKWLTVSLFAYASSALAVLVSVLVLKQLPLYELGVAFAPDAAMLCAILLVLLPLAFLVGALQCVAALRARTHKEAQIYLNLLQLAPMVLVVEQIGKASPPAAHLVPLLSQHAQVGALLSGQPIAPLAPVLAVSACVAGAAFLVWAGSRRLASERFVFGL